MALKPTVIIIGYGTNESFAGEAGLARFREQFNRLLDDLKPSKARIVLLAPPTFEKETWRAANFAARVQDLKLYTEAIGELADQRHALFAEEFWQGFALVPPLTDDGMHLTAYGYCATAMYLLTELGAYRSPKSVHLEFGKPKKSAQAFLPCPPIPRQSPPGLEGYYCDSFVIVHDLKPGRYTLKIDGLPVQTEDAQKWLNALYAGVGIVKGPSLDQPEKLRKLIVEKNRLFFNRWRPQNETYLYGFRKYEQGQNAREIPEFDPLIEKLEKEIARLRKPVPHTYQLVPAEEVKK